MLIPLLREAAVVVSVAVAATPASTAEFTQAPDLEYHDLKGAKVRIDFKSKPLTLVNFWAIWCLPCHEEMPQISRLIETYSSDGLQSVGIAVESGGPLEVARFLERNPELKVNYRILIGGPEALEKFGDIVVVPTTYLLGPDARVLETYMGVTPDFYGRLSADVRKHLPPGAPESGKVKAGAPPGKGDRSP
jgi:thiol-disulfide isomerase/thioredoxin